MKQRQQNRIWVLLLILTAAVVLSGCKQASADVPDTNGDGVLTCTMEVRCTTLLDHLDEMLPEKAALVPESGILFAEKEVEFHPGDSVFDVFRSNLKQEKIHFEYIDTRAYNSVYIEGIGNLYEFDCGPQSGWMYCVNGVYPGLGCSAYTLSDGDVIFWSYTCDLGADLGAEIQDGE